MGAALHLAHVHQPPPGPKRKRKDGDDDGPNEQLGKLVRRIMTDDRANHGTKELLVALAYALTTPREDGVSAWSLAQTALGKDRIGRWRIAELVSADAPCYKSPARYSHRGDGELYQLCSAPRIRPYKDKYAASSSSSRQSAFALTLHFDGEGALTDTPPAQEEDFRNRLGVCGSQAQDYAVEKLPDTGWHKVHWFCSRHRADLERARTQLAEKNKLAPEPIPNQGGLMPCYFDADWVKVYQHVLGERWKPPVYGVRADEWPIPGKEPVPQRARLRLAALDGELLAGAE